MYGLGIHRKVDSSILSGRIFAFLLLPRRRASPRSTASRSEPVCAFRATALVPSSASARRVGGPSPARPRPAPIVWGALARRYALLGFLDAVHIALLAVGLNYLPGSTYMLLKGTGLIFSVFMSKVFLAKRMTVHHWLAVCVMGVGLTMLAFAKGDGAGQTGGRPRRHPDRPARRCRRPDPASP